MKPEIINQTEKFQINIVRIAACLCIYLCHVFEAAWDATGSAIGALGGNLFNVGVPIFFMLSGYLYSTKKIKDKGVIKWYRKQAKKLLMPLWLLLIVIFVVHSIHGIYHSPIKWVQNIIPVIGLTQCYIPGLNHLWYITDLLACYLLTPLFMKKPAIKYPFAFAVGYVAVKLITAYIIPPIFCTMLASLGSFLFGFYYLQKLKKHFGKIIWLMPVVVILRIVFKFLLDDTPLYNEVLVDLCHKIFAVTIIAVVYAMAKRLYKKKCCVSMAEKMSGYTYEFYLVHSPIINGPVALPFGTNFIALGIVGFVVSTLAAWLLHYILTVLNKIIERK